MPRTCPCNESLSVEHNVTCFSRVGQSNLHIFCSNEVFEYWWHKLIAYEICDFWGRISFCSPNSDMRDIRCVTGAPRSGTRLVGAAVEVYSTSN